MTDTLRSLLAEVAEGRLDPSEAARRLSEMDRTPTADPWADATDPAVDPAGNPAADPGTTASDTATGKATGAARDAATEAPGVASPTAPAEPDSEPASAPAEVRVDRVLVQASARPVRVIADPTVATVTVAGPHAVRREGGTIRVDVPVTPGAERPGSYRYERKTGLSRWISQATLMGVPLTIRMNPDLPLEAEVMAGSLDVVGLRAPLTFSVTAGSLRAADCSGPFTGTVRAGGARIEGCTVSGASRVRVESGGVDVRLQPGSDVRVRAHAELGEVKIRRADGAGTGVIHGEGVHEVVVGTGTASMEIEVVMGSAKVHTP